MLEKEFWRSKKFWVAVIGAVCGVIKATCDIDLEYAIYPLMAYLIGQGIADYGKYKK